MKPLFYLLSMFIISCEGHKTMDDSTVVSPVPKKEETSAKPPEKKIADTVITITEPTVIVLGLDSDETNRLHKELGDEDFYINANDQAWYHSLMEDRMDSLGTPVLFTKKQRVRINNRYTAEKDGSMVYTYYFFDGDTLKKQYVFDFIDLNED